MADMSLAHKAEWLKDFRRRFAAEVKTLNDVEPFWRACEKCADGYCCGHKIFPVLQTEGNPFNAEEWFLQLEYVRDHFSAEDKQRLVQNISSRRPDCIFLFGNRCAVHPARTWACRVHPYVVSYHPAPTQFPVGEIALPSCPTLASSFGLKQDELIVQRPLPLSRHPQASLVKVKLRKRKPLWVVDATPYVKEYQQHLPLKLERPMQDWEELIELARQAGGREGDVLASYLEMVQGLTRTPDGHLGFEA
jgi:Fe-S-cluster containining protein